jgi:nicotinamidase-related amidase
MTSAKNIRDPKSDHLLTPENSALLIIDYQPIQVSSLVGVDKRTVVANITTVAKTAKLFGLPVVISTVNVSNGRNKPTIHQITEVFPDLKQIDRTSMNSWEDEDFVAAVKATGRKKLIMTALWTEVCLTFPSLDAMKDGYEVYPVVDAVGGTSIEAHRAGLERIVQAGGHPISWVSLLCELQRDWNRSATAKEFSDLLFAV